MSNSSRLLIPLRERILLLNSSTIKDYPWLEEFMKSTPNAKENDLDNFPEETRNFFKNIYGKVLKQASLEWTSKDEDPIDVLENGQEARCELCHRSIIYLCYIVNELNGNELLVGRRCVTHFGMDLKRPIDQLFKDMIKLKNLEKLNNRFPGIEKTVKYWDEYILELPIIIPFRLEKPYLELGKKIKLLYEEFINLEKSTDLDEYFDTFHDYLEEHEKLICEIEEYIKMKSNVKFIPTGSIRSWLLSNNRFQALKWLKEDEKISWRTIFRIEEPSFMESLIYDLNEVIKNNNLEIKEIAKFKGVNGYVVSILNKDNINIFIPFKKFLMDYGWLLFNNETGPKINLIDILDYSYIYGSTSIQQILNSLGLTIAKKGIDLVHSDIQFDDVIFKEKSTNRYIQISLRSFIDEYKTFLINIDTDDINSVISRILSPINNRISKKDIAYFLEQREYSVAEIKDILA